MAGIVALVGIVVVSHSRALADAAVALTKEMLPDHDVRIAVAAGLDDAAFGTDAGQIVDAITAADQGPGVVVLMDLGSAVLSAELALDLLEDELRDRVLLCAAPLVEGLIVAAVTAAGGAAREEVAAEAGAALAAKLSHLGPPSERTDPDEAGDDALRDELVGTFTVANTHGLHARPAARLVVQVRRFDAQVRLRNLTTRSTWVPGSSLSKVATLGALYGHQIEVRVSGGQAQDALDQVLTLATHDFGELDWDGKGTIAAGDQPLPLPAAPGIAIGRACSVKYPPLDIPDARTDDPIAEWGRLQEAIGAVRDDIRRIRARVAGQVGEADAAIFDAHLLLLDDPALLGEVQSRVECGQAAAPAWSVALQGISAQLAAIPDPYQQARADDLRAVREQVLRALLGVPGATAAASGVLLATDLTPAEAAKLNPSRVVAVLLAFGSPTAHSTIILRARGIAAVVAAGPAVLDIADGTLIAVDGGRGEFLVDPPAGVLQTWRAKAADLDLRERRALALAAEPARTRDGRTVQVGANIGSIEEARTSTSRGADLAGLVRTEFLFLDRGQAPDVEEQEAAYRSIADALEGRRITLRTLDAGADKPLDYLLTAPEANPSLGVRGIRLGFAHPRLLADQLLAIVRVAHDTPVSLMFPMISTLYEFSRARRMLEEAITSAGHGQPPGLRIGIMVEIPATALKAATFAPHVDFLSIGTNDLTQYALATDRGNDAVASVGDPFDPGVLRLVNAVCQGAGPQALVAVCGEIAADERACALLIGLGVRELSVTPPAIPMTKQAVRHLDSHRAIGLARRALDADSADAVRELLAQHQTY